MNLIKVICVLVVSVSLLITFEPLYAGDDSKTCTMGVFPFLSAQRMEAVFAPIAAELSTVSDCRYRYQSAADFNAFMAQLKKRKYDIAFVQPFDYVKIAASHGYRPLVARNGLLYAVIVTRPDSDIRSLQDLKGKTIALPPSVAAVSYLTKVMLDHKGLKINDDVQLVYSKNHGSCMHKVLIGKVDACATAPATLRLFEVKNRQNLRIIARSPSIPHALFVVRDDIPAEKFLKLQNKLLYMTPKTSAHQYFINDASSGGFRMVRDGDYDAVREYCVKYRPIVTDGQNYQCQ